MEYIMETKSLSKSFHGREAVKDISMHIKKGEIYGFVGPNGAGKSTVLKMILNLITPDGGERYIFGEHISSNNYKMLKDIGSLIESPYFYSNLTGRENLELHCEYMGFYNEEQIDRVLEMVSLRDIGSKAVKHYSLGMKQRLAIARAILTRPKLLILDEPINALDAEGIKEMRNLFLKLKEEWETTIIISSHILSEVELIADTIGIISKGELIKEVSMSDIAKLEAEYFELQVDDTKKSSYYLEEELGIRDIEILDDHKMRIYSLERAGRYITSALVKNGVGLDYIYKHKNTLEDYYLKIIKEGEK